MIGIWDLRTIRLPPRDRHGQGRMRHLDENVCQVQRRDVLGWCWVPRERRVAAGRRVPVQGLLRLHVQQGVQPEQRREVQVEQQPQGVHRGGHGQGLRPPRLQVLPPRLIVG
ncbi:hypothetical protein BASA81_000018 [Batrachochytrium salamandrivorans]|nr:hypothetical protein BASA81_000018 [Batrachochytrium salamandrivorans]